MNFKAYLCALMTLLLSLTLTSVSTAAEKQTLQQQIEVQNPVIFQLKPGAKGTGSKMTIYNNTDKKLVIDGFSCEGFAMTMLHQSKFEGGQRKMYEVSEISVPAHKKLALTPNTHHLMMFKPQHPLKTGEFLTMKVHTNQGEFKIIAKVVPHRLK
ncbi:hypothetical protein VQ7734_00942 [Vibrio quintilis]|uniref:Copper chaperone PCu(A)C n=2 Tax=Vibrio quintilis TaxID=1117707 RepID=A0A1M7YRJ2_9VIBR|nr:hypothetical protein VQ7734_00942 [Vibrio quintilis]